MSKYTDSSKKLLKFIEESPTCFHAVANLAEMLKKAGFSELKETDKYKVTKGGKYFVTRNDSSILAFVVPKTKVNGYHISAAHSDSPCFKIKENPEIVAENHYIKLNVEKYGGMIDSPWLDRPLSVAGRVVCKVKNKWLTKLVNIKKDLLIIPNLAIHMDREINKGKEYNAQNDLAPLYALGSETGSFMDLIAKEAGVKAEEIYGHDLFLYPRTSGGFLGPNDEMIYSPRLDDLHSAYGCMMGLIDSEPKDFINVCVVFDNEEIGSGTKQGADSTFLEDNLRRIEIALEGDAEDLTRKIAGSFLISSDNAHAVHPNHPEKADPTNRPYLNGGIVIKFHGSQKYATDAVSAAKMKDWCKNAKVPFQTYHNRS
ncbi:MAG: M18 family aminopeptidase, partial [Lachnospiraceae bacterium]|nr:M18 family aminopeptidase [Lachnospiraceae bacterium]